MRAAISASLETVLMLRAVPAFVRDLELGTAHILTVTDIDLAFSELDFLVIPAGDSLQGIAGR